MEKDNSVSVIIPVFNGQNYLEKALTSCLNQSYKNIEIVVVDDGSEDGTYEIVKNFIAKDDRVKYFRKENGGVASALNFGLEKISGDYFTWLSHDDTYHPKKIEEQIHEIQKYDANTIIFCDYSLMNKYGDIIEKVDLLKYNYLGFERNPLYALFQSSINGCCLLIPRNIFSKQAFKFNENLHTTQDYDLWYRIFQNSNLVHMSRNLVNYRIHEEQDSQKSPNLIKENEELWSFFAKEIFAENIWVGPQDSKVILAHLAGHLIKTDFQQTVDYIGNLLIEKIKLDSLGESEGEYKIIKVRNNQMKLQNIVFLPYLKDFSLRFSDVTKSDEQFNLLMLLLSGTSVLIDSACNECKEMKMTTVSYQLDFKSLFCKKIKAYVCAMEPAISECDLTDVTAYMLRELIETNRLTHIDCSCKIYQENFIAKQIRSDKNIRKIVLNGIILSTDINTMNLDIYKVLVKNFPHKYKFILLSRLIINFFARRIIYR
jgi:glycosyltransferase involved in cell wall biosynthesis